MHRPGYRDAPRLRADLRDWAADEFARRHHAFRTYLLGCSSHEAVALSMLGGVEDMQELIAAFVGYPGVEMSRLRAVGPAIEDVNWQEHDR